MTTSARATGRLSAAEQRVHAVGGRVARATEVGLTRRERVLDGAGERLGREARRSVVNADRRLDLLHARAVALDPAVTMARGWSITRTDDGALVRSTEGLGEGADLVTTVADGEVRSRVTGERR
ncbi:MAG: exodeoxyribonuclease VII large subunit [Acidimicrobiales bacterium]